jgi:hypothetical protein
VVDELLGFNRNWNVWINTDGIVPHEFLGTCWQRDALKITEDAALRSADALLRWERSLRSILRLSPLNERNALRVRF